MQQADEVQAIKCKPWGELRLSLDSRRPRAEGGGYA